MITFKKKVNNTIFLSDNKEKYEIVHSYFSFSENEIPYDSHIFLEKLNSGHIVVVSVSEGKHKWDFSQWMEKDEFIEEQNEKLDKVKSESDKIIKKQVKEKLKKEIEIEKKEKKEKEKKEKEKNKVSILKDEDILNKL